MSPDTPSRRNAPKPWIAGSTPSLSGAGVWRVAGPEPSGRVADTEAEPVDVELLEALKRLGYAE